MRMAIRAVEAGYAGEMIFASGKTWNGRDFVEQLFARYDLDYQRHIEVSESVSSPWYEVDLAHTHEQIDAGPCEDILALCDRLITQPRS